MKKEGIRVLVVDDSPVVRQAIRTALEKSPVIIEVSTAATGSIALKKIQKNLPDVVTLDIEMPGMDGIETLKAIQAIARIPVIMLSAYTYEGAERTIKALELGAVDFIQKPGGRLSRDVVVVADELISSICAVVGTSPASAVLQESETLPLRTNLPGLSKATRPLPVPGAVGVASAFDGLVAIGASTGGTEAIRQVLVKLPENFSVGIVIVQHMPPGFTRAFANRLDELCQLKVKEAAPRDMVLPGRVLISPGHSHMTVHQGQYGLYVDLNRSGKVNGHMPSVDVLFHSVAALKDDRITSVLLTGMGRDGASGMKEILNSGGSTLAQDSATSVVFGMPRAAIELEAAQRVLPIGRIAPELIRMYPHRETVWAGKAQP